MRTRSHQQKVLSALPGVIRRLVSTRSKFARDAIDEYSLLCRENKEAIERRLDSLVVSGDPVAWHSLNRGRQTAIVAAQIENDAREHAVSLANRLLDERDQGNADRRLLD